MECWEWWKSPRSVSTIESVRRDHEATPPSPEEFLNLLRRYWEYLPRLKDLIENHGEDIPEESTPGCCQGEVVQKASTGQTWRRPRMDACGLGCEYENVWWVYKRRKGRWRQYGKFSASKGVEAFLMQELAETGGYLGKYETIKGLLRWRGVPLLCLSNQDIADLMRKTIKPSLSRLRKKMRKAFGLPEDADPLSWQDDSKGWRAMIEVGFAVQEDSPYAGTGDRLVFKTKQAILSETEWKDVPISPADEASFLNDDMF